MKKVGFSSLAFGMAPAYGSELIRRRCRAVVGPAHVHGLPRMPNEEPSPFGMPSAYQVIASGGSLVSAKTVTTRIGLPR